MTGISAVCIYDDLSSGQSGITVRSSDYETAGGIDKELRFAVNHILRQNRIEHVFFDIFMNLLLAHFRTMLCGKHYSIQPEGLAVLVILYCHLGLSIRTQVGQGSVLANLGQLQRQFVRQRDGIRHIFFCFIVCIAEHHTLVAGTDGVDVLIGHGVLFASSALSTPMAISVDCLSRAVITAQVSASKPYFPRV